MATTTFGLNPEKQWIPETESEAKLKTALETALITSPSSVITTSPDKKSNRFILQTQGYHDLYLYVSEGIKFTDTKEQFEKDFTKKVFATVNDIDPQAYDQLRDTTVNVATHCKDFNTNGLGRLTTSANGAIAYSEHAIDLLKGKADMDLYNAFQVLLAEKYATSPKDDAFEEALETAELAVKSLQKSAKSGAEDAKNMVDLLQSFYTKTDNDLKAVQLVEHNFLTGPLDPTTGKRKLKSDGKEQEPYSDVLDAEINRLQGQISKDLVSKKEAHDQWEKSRDAAIGYGVAGWFVFWFWIGSGIETSNAIKAKKQYDDLVAKIIEEKQEKADIVRVLELVRGLVNHFEELLPKMEKALAAMTELHKLFQAQDLNFQQVGSSLTDLQTGVSAKGWRNRKIWIENAIDEAVEKFKEIKDLGEEFNRGAVPDIKPLTDK
ncbi:hypothetical protein F5Y19DRAFT_448904 [Xylariaceae sp. FL1651]|nr:hypothetical protein F5Y19DRAFT_448904 [Xylariaceae sp. FL1651]